MRTPTRAPLKAAAAAAAAVAALAAMGLAAQPSSAAPPSTYGPEGVDTSHNNHGDGRNTGAGRAIEWPQVARAGHAFAFVKATEGVDWTDRWFTRDLAGTARAGLLHAPYHLYGRTPGASQARYFVTTVRAAGYTGRGLNELPPALDLEPRPDGTCPANLSRKEVGAFLATVQRELTVKPIVYTSAGFVNTCLGGRGTDFATHTLWQPRYASGQREPDAVPGAGRPWTFWQYSEKGKVPGIAAATDRNVFRGNLTQLRALAASSRSSRSAPSRQLQTTLSWPTVRTGSRGAAVTAVQHLLTAHGRTVKADGVFGSRTAAALKAFQRERHQTPDGIAGPRAWSALIVTVRTGSRGAAVTAVQHLLSAHGRTVKADGVFGSRTAAALKTFQRERHQTPDGIAGPRAWSALVNATSSTTPAPTGRAPHARQILNHRSITLNDFHPTTHDAASTPLRNIRDTALGKGALTSRGSDVGARRVPLNARMLRGILTLTTRYGFRFTITEIAGGDHGTNSRHYAGLAFDTNRINGAKVSTTGARPAVNRFKAACRALGATEILGPGDRGHSTHVHCAWPRR
ncbi:GH25 family lysozyme [Actinacidiphila glaucinigra]|uniref:GH25 family lysozyme n=1 Tax=Actinacidiphila glaucinigra TaxID=235986 RepID=UPI0037C86582